MYVVLAWISLLDQSDFASVPEPKRSKLSSSGTTSIDRKSQSATLEKSEDMAEKARNFGFGLILANGNGVYTIREDSARAVSKDERHRCDLAYIESV